MAAGAAEEGGSDAHSAVILDSRATVDGGYGDRRGHEQEYEPQLQHDNGGGPVQDIHQGHRPARLARSHSVSHKQVQPPRYVRSNPIGLQRANTLNSSTTCSPAKDYDTNPGSTPASGNADLFRTRRISVPCLNHEDTPTLSNLPMGSEPTIGLLGATSRPAEETSPVKLHFPRTYNRLPPAAPDKKLQSLLYDYGDTSRVSDLPSDPKAWTPSQLSIYLSHMLKLTPRPVIADVMKFVVQRGLTGKRFLRLRNQDLIEMGINISWCRVLSTARERLRRECLRGRIFGFTIQNTDESGGPSTTAEDGEGEETIESLFLRLPTSASATSTNQEWNKNSWRRTEGKKSRGRVKGIARVFEEGNATEGGSELDELGRKRSGSAREAELNESSRMRRTRQESTDSLASNASDSGIPCNSAPNSPGSTSNSIYAKFSPDKTNRHQDHIDGTSGSESEAEEVFGAPANKVDWLSVEPLAMEETCSLTESFLAETPPLAVPSSSSSHPSTPCASIPGSPVQHDVEGEDKRPDEKELEMTGVSTAYQSGILSHGQEAYAAVRARKQPDLSEVTDELSEEHLAYWRSSSPQKKDRDAKAYDRLPSPSVQNEADLPGIQSAETEATVKPEVESASITFAESDGNIITVKKHPQPLSSSIMGTLKKRTRSVEEFGNLEFHTVQSRKSTAGSTRIALKDLFGEEVHGGTDKGGSWCTAAGSRPSTKHKNKDSMRPSDLPKDAEEYDQYHSLKSRSGSVMVLPRAEVEEMQARLRNLEQELEIAKSAFESRHSCHSKSSAAGCPSSCSQDVRDQSEDSKSKAMSEWVKGALGEANTIVGGESQEPSWLGLGSWALAAGLGIGIVVGEVVFSKLRR